MQTQNYLPSSSERKRAVTAYLLIGILFFSSKEELTVYEYYHFRQSIGWFTLFVFSLLVWVVFLWLPIIRWLLFLPVLLSLCVRVYFVFKAWRGEYSSDTNMQQRWKLFYVDFGGWVLNIFEIKKRVYGDIWLDNASEILNVDEEKTSE